MGKPFILPFVQGDGDTYFGNGHITRSLPFMYNIRCFSISGNVTNKFDITVQQDERSILRQEYWNRVLLSIPLELSPENQISVPNYNEFTSNINIVINGHTNFSFNEFRENINYYNWIIIDDRLTNGLTQTRIAFNTNMDVSSIWRNPERDEAVGGVINSCHMYGFAADILVRDWNHDGFTNGHLINATNINSTWTNIGDDWVILASIARTNANAYYIEPYRITGTWVHMDWWRIRE